MKAVILSVLAAAALCAGEAKPRIRIDIDGTDQSVQYGRRRADVRVIMPNGQHIIVTCLSGLRACFTLNQGQGYSAEIEGNSLWIYGIELGGKEHRAKFAMTGSW